MVWYAALSLFLTLYLSLTLRCISPSPSPPHAVSHLTLLIYTAIDWDHISKSTPPMKPSAKDINTATQSEIGSFQDERVSRRLLLTDDDHRTYEKWEFLSKPSFQEEIVDFLTFEDKVVRHSNDYSSSFLPSSNLFLFYLDLSDFPLRYNSFLLFCHILSCFISSCDNFELCWHWLFLDMSHIIGPN